MLFGETYKIDVEMISENDAPVTAAQKESYKEFSTTMAYYS